MLRTATARSMRTMAVSARQPASSASSSSRWMVGGAVAVAGIFGGAAWSTRSPLSLESRPSFSERMKGVKPVEIRRRQTKIEEQEEEEQEETPAPIKVAEEASQQSAYNQETGEINWDCPCLGGMAHGPCGEDFKSAFSCFIYSEEEPKGIDCVDKFKAMQDCFRKYPEIYAEEIEDDEAPLDEERLEEAAAHEAEEK